MDTKWPKIKKYNLTVYYTQTGPILVPSEVEAFLVQLDKELEENDISDELEERMQ